ncbi:class I SAM-dependent DNA methyltransferase [Leptospira levettii]|uniref:Methyltransferase domain-containing protein n=1 Tax=Leptospira levettii TaxID=2023178 RepID=A0AAW5VBN6_9LEPT|nr:class I SAM-dependent methyltransferase [Leptospira levettii]MCW7466211.1 methyltransferase domain-containing protein [Leptospira levettii]MCW7512264.1 methyltransferase domain-containing protein [Leptospira levettii]MCW7516272.1 methyltransferase domain-containing protein [Leptospira levettii]
MKQTKKHYDDIANEYNELRQTGLVGILVKKESEAIMERLNVRIGEEILDAGCGSGFYAEKILKLGGKVFGVDLSPEMVNVCIAKGVDAVQGDLTELNLLRQYKKILCAGSLEFIEDQRRLFTSLTSHLENSGQLYCLFPRFNWAGLLYWLYHFSHGVKIRLYGKTDCERIADENGLEIIDICYPEPLTKLVTFQKK